MDDLSPSCVTSRNGRIYAFGLTHVLSRGSVTSSAYFLIQSNPNPSQALDDLSWTLISSVDTSGYSDIKTSDTYGPFSASQFSCIMDDKGVFSILNIDGANIKAGLQYQPPSLGTSGTGVWKNITIPANYQWDRYDYAELFNYQDNQGKDTLMHVTQGELFNVYVASLDSSTMTMNQGIAPWNNTNTPLPNFRAVAVTSNGHSIFAYGEDRVGGSQWLFEYPLGSASTSPPGPAKTHNASSIRAVNPLLHGVLIKAVGNHVVVINGDALPARMFLFDGTDFNPLPPTPEGIPIGGADLRFMAAVDAAPNPFVLYHDNVGMYSVPLNGSLAGIRMTSTKKISVSPSSSPSSPSAIPTWTAKPPQARNNTGAIIGGVVGAVVLVIAILGLILCWRKRKLERSINSGEEGRNLTKPMQAAHQLLQGGPQPIHGRSMEHKGRSAYRLSSAPISLNIPWGQSVDEAFGSRDWKGKEPYPVNGSMHEPITPSPLAHQMILTEHGPIPSPSSNHPQPDQHNPSQGFP